MFTFLLVGFRRDVRVRTRNAGTRETGMPQVEKKPIYFKIALGRVGERKKLACILQFHLLLLATKLSSLFFIFGPSSCACYTAALNLLVHHSLELQYLRLQHFNTCRE